VGVIYRLSILVSADVSQPIQKILGIDYLMSADINNVSVIRGVPRRCETLIVVNFFLRHQAA
jgi:hypothetical protein